MADTYDTYYQTENLFGEPYPELIEFMTAYPNRGKVLDLGCGQGRDAIALAQLGYSVTGIDSSKVGIDQMNQIAHTENLNLVGLVDDIYAFDSFKQFDIIILDSMFHFAKKDRAKEVGLVRKIVSNIENGSLLVVCIQDTGEKVQILNLALNSQRRLKKIADLKFTYTFEDSESEHASKTPYRMIVVEK